MHLTLSSFLTFIMCICVHGYCMTSCCTLSGISRETQLLRFQRLHLSRMPNFEHCVFGCARVECVIASLLLLLCHCLFMFLHQCACAEPVMCLFRSHSDLTANMLTSLQEDLFVNNNLEYMYARLTDSLLMLLIHVHLFWFSTSMTHSLMRS